MKLQKTTSVNIIIFVAILILVNLLSLSIFKRFDFSKGNIYSLSRASKEAVKKLDDRLIIKAYFSKNLPGEYADARRFTQDILSEYQAYSHGKLRFEFIDPSDEEKLKKEAQQHQIFPASMRVVENDKFVVREVYMGLVFLYQDKKENIPLVENTRGLEYDITKKIKKIASIGLKKIAFYDIEKTPPQMRGYQQQNQSDFATLQEHIAESYELQKTDLTSEIAADVEVLIMAGIEDSLSKEQLFNLDQYLMKNGNLVLLQNRVTTDMRTQQANLINSNLFQLLNHYGIHIKENIIADANCGQVNVQQQRGIFRMMTPVNYPFFPIIHNFNKENLIVKNIDQMQLVYASEIDTTNIGGFSFEPLLSSSNNSGAVTKPQLDIGVQKYMDKDLKTMFIDPPKILGGIFSGSISSYFANNPEYNDATPTSKSTQIILVTDSDFVKEGIGANVENNLNFVLNSVDYLAAEETLIEIRSRQTEYKPLKEISSGMKKVVRWLNILLPSILLIIIGLIRYQKEMNKRKIIGELYE